MLWDTEIEDFHILIAKEISGEDFSHKSFQQKENIIISDMIIKQRVKKISSFYNISW